ncbi:MAG: ATP-binding protein [Clostridia bacterium]|nr:ATP-binding protein [Clostridia bacterium]
MSYLKRQMEESIINASKTFPVVMVCGQSQTGKSTMLKHLAESDRKYVSFDDAKVRTLVKNDPELFFETYGYKLFIDEFQRVPSILLEIKKIVDERNENGMFWLSGSQKFVMMKNVSESLAGRVAVFDLLPLSYNEISSDIKGPFSPELELLKKKQNSKRTLKEVFEDIFNGGLPKIVLNADVDRDIYYSSYINTYIERDISSLEQVGKLEEFRTFVTYMAANTAQELKYDSISKVVGVSAPTIKEWVSILERSGIIYIISPYASNMTKRLVKTPKCYFLDTGLAAYLTSWPTAETLMNGNSAGAFFETYVVGEILKGFTNMGKKANLYYYRDIDQKEIDLLMVESDSIYPIEIKKGKNPSISDKNFAVLNKLGQQIKPGLIICLADELFPINKDIWYCPLGLI